MKELKADDPIWIINDRGYMVPGKVVRVQPLGIEIEYDGLEGTDYHYDCDDDQFIFHKQDIDSAIDRLNEIMKSERERYESIQTDVIEAIRTLNKSRKETGK